MSSAFSLVLAFHNSVRNFTLYIQSTWLYNNNKYATSKKLFIKNYQLILVSVNSYLSVIVKDPFKNIQFSFTWKILLLLLVYILHGLFHVFT